MQLSSVSTNQQKKKRQFCSSYYWRSLEDMGRDKGRDERANRRGGNDDDDNEEAWLHAPLTCQKLTHTHDRLQPNKIHISQRQQHTASKCSACIYKGRWCYWQPQTHKQSIDSMDSKTKKERKVYRTRSLYKTKGTRRENKKGKNLGAKMIGLNLIVMYWAADWRPMHKKTDKFTTYTQKG